MDFLRDGLPLGFPMIEVPVRSVFLQSLELGMLPSVGLTANANPEKLAQADVAAKQPRKFIKCRMDFP